MKEYTADAGAALPKWLPSARKIKENGKNNHQKLEHSLGKTTPLSKTVILTAPQGWGKTRNAEALQKEFGCSAVVDEWNHSQPLKKGVLHLTNEHPHSFRNNKPEIYQLVSRGWN